MYYTTLGARYIVPLQVTALHSFLSPIAYCLLPKFDCLKLHFFMLTDLGVKQLKDFSAEIFELVSYLIGWLTLADKLPVFDG